MNNILIITLCIIFVSGCSQINSRVDIAKRAKSELVGMSKSEILECAGVPLETYKDNDTELMTYSNQDISNYSDAIGLRFMEMIMELDECEATLSLKNDVVYSVNYKTNFTGLLASDDQCAYVFEDCLSKIGEMKQD